MGLARPLFSESLPSTIPNSVPVLNSDFEQTQSSILKSLSEKTTDENRLRLLLSLASAYLDNGEPEQANVILRGLSNSGLKEKPAEATKFLETRVQEKQGNLDKAVLIAQDIKSDKALLKTGLLLEAQGQSYAAILKFQELLKSYPQSPLIPAGNLALANSYLTLGELEQAQKQIDAASALPKNLSVLKQYLAGSIAFQSGNYDAAKKTFASIDENAPAFIKASSALLAGMSDLKGNRAPDGEAALNVLLKSPETDVAFEAAFQLVRHNLMNGQPEKAVEVCNAVLPELASGHNEKRIEIILLRAISYEKAGRTDQATADFKDVVSANEKTTATKALVLLAHTLWIERKYDKLTTDFPDLLKNYRANASAKNDKVIELDQCDLLIGEANLSWRQFAAAEKIFSQLLLKPLSPSLSAKATGGLVAALVAQQKFGEAQKRLEELMVRFGDDRAVVKFGLLAQAHLLWNKGDYGLAAASYQKYAEMFPQDDDAPLALYMEGRSLEKTGQSADAFQTWEGVAKKYPDSSYSARSLVRSAALADRLGDKGRAETYYAKMAGANNSKMVELALLQIGLTRLKSNEDVEAVKTLNQFVEKYPLSNHGSEAAAGLKDAYQQIAYSDPARLTVLAAQFSSSPYTGEAYYWMGMKEKDPAKAIPNFEKVLAEYPRTPSFSRALFYKGQAELDLKDYKAALVSLGRFIKDSPDKDLTVIARYQRAGALAKAEFPDEAILEYQAVIKEAPYSTYASQSYLKWAQLLHTQSNYDAETRVYQAFLKDFPDDKNANEIYWRLGQLARRAGDYPTALAYFKKVTPAEGVAGKQDLEEAIQSLGKLVSKSEARP